MQSSFKVPEDHQLPEAAQPPMLESGHQPKLIASARGQAPAHMRKIITVAGFLLLALLLFGMLRHYRQQKVVEAQPTRKKKPCPL